MKGTHIDPLCEISYRCKRWKDYRDSINHIEVQRLQKFHKEDEGFTKFSDFKKWWGLLWMYRRFQENYTDSMKISWRSQIFHCFLKISDKWCKITVAKIKISEIQSLQRFYKDHENNFKKFSDSTQLTKISKFSQRLPMPYENFKCTTKIPQITHITQNHPEPKESNPSLPLPKSLGTAFTRNIPRAPPHEFSHATHCTAQPRFIFPIFSSRSTRRKRNKYT